MKTRQSVAHQYFLLLMGTFALFFLIFLGLNGSLCPFRDDGVILTSVTLGAGGCFHLRILAKTFPQLLAGSVMTLILVRHVLDKTQALKMSSFPIGDRNHLSKKSQEEFEGNTESDSRIRHGKDDGILPRRFSSCGLCDRSRKLPRRVSGSSDLIVLLSRQTCHTVSNISMYNTFIWTRNTSIK